MTTLEVEALTHRSGSFALQEITLDCPSGGCLALLGSSGSGKTTCLEIMAGLREAHSGSVRLDGVVVTRWPPEKRSVSYLPQDVALFPHLSVRENIEFPARMRRQVADSMRLKRICEMLEIESLLDRKGIDSLSGGEAQRVAIARSLLVPPKVLFLDECFGSLDAPLRRRLSRQFRDLRELTGTTTVVVTHDLDEASFLADRLAILDHGRLLQVGTTQQLHQAPRATAVAELLGMHNLFPVLSCDRIGDHWRCQLPGCKLHVPRREESSPPEHIGFFAWDPIWLGSASASPATSSGPNNRMSLCVLATFGRGPVIEVRLATQGPRQTVIEALWPLDFGKAPPARGELIDLEVPAQRIRSWPHRGP